MSQNSSSSLDHAPGASLPQSLPTVCHYSNNFLSLSKTFVYRQITSTRGVRHVVITKQVVNQDIYPFSPICCLTKPDGQPASLSEHRERWREFLLKEDVRLVHAHFANNALDILPVAAKLGIPLVVTLYGNDMYRCGREPRYAPAYQMLFRRAQGVLAVSDGLRLEAIRLGCPPEKLRTHHLGLALDEFSYQERTLADAEPVRFLHVSNFVPKKGVPILIRAFKRVHEAFPRTELLLAGNGVGIPECRRLTSELGLEGCVSFLGPRPPADIPRLMRSAHIFVQPSVTAPDGSAEGIPCVIVEAMATGTPVIGTRHGGIPEVVRDGQTGLLVEERDEKALADGMIALATHPETWAALSRAAVADVRERFDQVRQSARLATVYGELALLTRRRKKPRVRVLITNSVPLNGGDAAILMSMLHDIKRETNSDIRVMVNDLPRVRPLFPTLKLLPALEEAGLSEGEKPNYTPRRRWAMRMRLAAWMTRLLGKRLIPLRGDEAKAINAYANCDVVVSAGGGFLSDNYVTLPNKICGFDVAAILRKPVVIYAQSLGPFRSKRSRRAMKRVMRRAALVIVRDRASFEEALSLGADRSKLYLTADAAFALSPDLDLLPVDHVAPAPGGLNIGVSVREWRFPGRPGGRRALMAAYENAMARLCEHLVRQRGARLTFVSTCQGVPGYADDSAVAAEILSALPPELRGAITLEREYFDPFSFRRRLAGFDAYVGMRMHSLIAASLLLVPAVGIACEQKTIDLFQELGMQDYVLSAEEAAAEKYIEVTDRLLDSRDKVCETLEQRVPLLIRRARQSVVLLAELFDRLPRRP